MKDWEKLTLNLSREGWSWSCFARMDAKGRDVFVIDAQRDGKHFIVRADEKLTAFRKLESAIRPTSVELQFLTKQTLATQFAPQGSQAE